jgi:hypothetical protein
MTAPVVERALRELEKHHELAMLVAQQEERARCLRVVASWSRFASAHKASPETHAILLKLAIEIGAGDDPDEKRKIEITFTPPEAP